MRELSLARFTTVDPIRDGTNWLVYCNGDAVNFVDLWGLEAADGAVVKKNNFSLSEDGIKFLKVAEGFKKDSETGLLTVYNDSNGNATKGYGILLHYGPYTEEDKLKNPDQTETEEEVKTIWLNGYSETSEIGKRRINEWRIYYEGIYAEDPYK